MIENMVPSAELGTHVKSDHDPSMIGNLMCLEEAKHGASSSSSSAYSISSAVFFFFFCSMHSQSTQDYGNNVALYEWEESRTPLQLSVGVKKKESGRHSSRECVGTGGRVGVILWEAFQYNSQSVFYFYVSLLNLNYLFKQPFFLHCLSLDLSIHTANKIKNI